MDRLWVSRFEALFERSTVTVAGLSIGHFTMGLRVAREYCPDVLLLFDCVQYLDVRPVMHCERIRRLTAEEVAAIEGAVRYPSPHAYFQPEEYGAALRGFALECAEGTFTIWAASVSFREPYDEDYLLRNLSFPPAGPLWSGGPALSELMPPPAEG